MSNLGPSRNFKRLLIEVQLGKEASKKSLVLLSDFNKTWFSDFNCNYYDLQLVYVECGVLNTYAVFYFYWSLEQYGALG